MTKETERYITIMLEQLTDHVKVIFEVVGSMQETVKSFATKADMERVENRIKIVEIVVKDTSKDLKKLDSRVGQLELMT